MIATGDNNRRWYRQKASASKELKKNRYVPTAGQAGKTQPHLLALRNVEYETKPLST